MFISLGSVLSGFTNRHKIKNQIDKITTAEKSDRIIKSAINADIKIVWCRGGSILLKTKTSAAANEVRLMDARIKAEFKRNNIQISLIKCII